MGCLGYSKFRFIGALTGAQIDAAAANIRTFFDGVKAYMPSIVTMAVQSGVSMHQDDGTLTQEATIAALPSPVVGTGAGAYSSVMGFMVRWNTGAINGGKKIVGRTYFVPTSSQVTQSDGTIIELARTTIQAAATAFATSTPSPAINSRARPNNPAAGDQTAAVISATVPDKQVVLRTRRD